MRRIISDVISNYEKNVGGAGGRISGGIPGMAKLLIEFSGGIGAEIKGRAGILWLILNRK